MAKVFSFFKPYRLAIGIALFFMFTELAVELVQPLLMAKIIDEGIMANDYQAVLLWGAIMVGATIFSFASGIINSFYAGHVSQSLSFNLRKALFEKIQDFSFSVFAQFPSSSYITRLTNDITQLQNIIFMGLRIMLRAPLLIAGSMIMALTVNVKLGLFLLITTPLLFFFLLWLLKKGANIFGAVQRNLDHVNAIMQENLAAMKLIKALIRGKHEVKRFIASNDKLKDKTIYALRLMESSMPVLLLLMNLGLLGVLWISSIDVRNGQVQVGEVVAIVNYATRITGALSMVAFIIMGFSRAKASAERISEVLDTEEADRQEGNNEAAIRGKVEFRNVSFRYPGTNTEVLHDLSFTAYPGEKIAIMGATGSGKSTLFQLIPRLYESDKGSIMIDNQPIEGYKIHQLRKQIGFVPQEALLFSGTIKENIRWGKEDATMNEVIAAAKSAQIHDTIDRLPNKYETVLGQKGVNLSGGQKQRLSIARALVRRPKLLFLDDSTSALDLKTEALLLKAINDYDCTLFIITQKISTAMKADQILLLEDGKLLEKGKHEELVRTSKLYQRIYKSQFGKESLNYVQANY
ncbi:MULTISPECIES: ABC transporter ATP-binding protein [Bacillus]|uniref:ABC transporter ATP-binding protein n=2 Tax=Bacillus TaxID=1386 RepID=A0A0M4G6A5_9BACI|nr:MULTISPECIES: ABC transporter ATP-binding protein [Bacillus]ALC80383.1 ABC transporter ATP-binding protein [Bacillus gobiensis]MBP1083767.1 ATP-binding cassette subfamily B protein [Bacillus capparidis]MED1098252.1 ABC transporter ATP-binding protein [Bacillus capparidis]